MACENGFGTYNGHFSNRALLLNNEINRIDEMTDKVITSSILHGYSQSFKRKPFSKQLRKEYEKERRRAAVRISKSIDYIICF